MKTYITKSSITTTIIIGLVALIAFSAHTARTAGRHHNAQTQTEIKIAAPNNYGEVMNNLFGR